MTHNGDRLADYLGDFADELTDEQRDRLVSVAEQIEGRYPEDLTEERLAAQELPARACSTRVQAPTLPHQPTSQQVALERLQGQFPVCSAASLELFPEASAQFLMIPRAQPKPPLARLLALAQTQEAYWRPVASANSPPYPAHQSQYPSYTPPVYALCAIVIISANCCAFRLVPPTSKPSISEIAK